MLSLVHRCFTHNFPSRSFTLSLVPRCFSITHRRLTASSAPFNLEHTKDTKPNKKRNEARKFRYANDPEYRAKILAQVKAWQQTHLANDPEYRAKIRARKRVNHNHRYANDPEYRAKCIARTLAAEHARYRSDVQFRAHRSAERVERWAKQDPVAKEEELQRRRVHNTQKYADDYTHKQRHSFQNWLRRYIPIRELTWRTHDAELHAEQVVHLCSGKRCGFEKKLKLWMKRKDSDPALYDCYKCFVSDWVPGKVLPVGYEHVVFGSGEKIEPSPVPISVAGDKASRDTNPSSGVGTIS